MVAWIGTPEFGETMRDKEPDMPLSLANLFFLPYMARALDACFGTERALDYWISGTVLSKLSVTW